MTSLDELGDFHAEVAEGVARIRGKFPAGTRGVCQECEQDRYLEHWGLCHTCYRRWRRTRPENPTASDRFWAKVQMAGALECWEWTATRLHGYGQFWAAGRLVLAHRWSYEFLIEAIPEGLHIDHLCRNRACVNPWHLEPVTQRVNTQRASSLVTTCKWGHEFTPENTILRKPRAGCNPSRACRTCTNARRRRAREAQKASAK